MLTIILTQRIFLLGCLYANKMSPHNTHVIHYALKIKITSRNGSYVEIIHCTYSHTSARTHALVKLHSDLRLQSDSNVITFAVRRGNPCETGGKTKGLVHVHSLLLYTSFFFQRDLLQ